jgi:hypothetical protein
MSPRGLAVFAAPLLLVAGLLVAGCGGGKVLDGQATEAQISDHLASTFGLARPAVTCPGGVKVTAGKTFACHTDVEGQPLTVDVTLTDGRGHFTIRPASAVVVVAKIAAALQVSEPKTTLRCGTHTVLIEPPHADFDCTAATAAGPVTYHVTVQDLAGNVSYQPVATPQAG